MRCALLAAVLTCSLSSAGSTAAETASEPLQRLLASIPTTTDDVSDRQTQDLVQAAEQLEEWLARQWWADDDADEIVATVRRLIDVKSQVDQALAETLDLRTRFAALPPDDQRRATLRNYLKTTSEVIDISGWLRYRLHDVIESAAYYLDPHPKQLNDLLDVLIERRVSIGAVVMCFMLFDPPADSDAVPFSAKEKYKALQLITETREAALLPVLADFIRQEKDPALVVIGAAAIRIVGVPQSPRPGSDGGIPAPAITANELYKILEGIDESRLSKSLVEYRRKLLAWFKQRMDQGVTGDSFRWGRLEVQAGDWLLMRNPSPYNHFTDLSPGLFTHVGVVAVEEGSDGIRRFVIVDLPERGAHIPATNLDVYFERTRTLHYFFLRHDDPAVCAKMGQAAQDMIGNEAQFDLAFDTSRVAAMKDKPLKDAPIHTYCAGFLLLCAQQSSAPRSEFFPFSETPTEGKTRENLGRLGLSIGQDFISPTGAIFSPRLQIAGRREPMYDPAREVQEAIYDYFAKCMAQKTLTPSPDAHDLLIQKAAELSENLPWLARALARANDVSEDMDLEAAAKAAAVVGTLDEISEENLSAFVEARAAIVAGKMDEEAKKRYSPEAIQRIESYRERHAELFKQWSASQLSARELRIALVEFYVQRGQTQLDERFFRPRTDQ